MPDARRHRGPHPADTTLFADAQVPALRHAVNDLSWLLTREYSDRSALKLVGDRYQLTERQRTAVMRCSCSDPSLAARHERRITDAAVSGRRVAIDGFNLITSIEAALAGGIIILGRDDCCRDMASMHGTYRRVHETEQAVTLIGQQLDASNITHAHWLLDRPVSNSGRLSKLIEHIAAEHSWSWTTELHDNPDRQLIAIKEHVVVSADSVIIENCETWWPLANETIEQHVPQAWKVDLG